MADLSDPPGRPSRAPAAIRRRQMVDAMLFIGRTCCQWYVKRVRRRVDASNVQNRLDP